ncbi:hypothetical protein C2859_03955 [Xanthomonas citri pv. glycines]|nr:hypothetical protein C2859_03955 [Xanthomonas citri pv. glycines]
MPARRYWPAKSGWPQSGYANAQCACPHKHGNNAPAGSATSTASEERRGACIACCAVGCWLLAVGCWLLAVGCWLLAVGCWLLAVIHAASASPIRKPPTTRCATSCLLTASQAALKHHTN